MVPKGSLSYSQEPATDPYSEPNKSSPHSLVHPIYLRSILIIFSQEMSSVQAFRLEFLCTIISVLTRPSHPLYFDKSVDKIYYFQM
jgi:hypothetical protein